MVMRVERKKKSNKSEERRRLKMNIVTLEMCINRWSIFLSVKMKKKKVYSLTRILGEQKKIDENLFETCNFRILRIMKK